MKTFFKIIALSIAIFSVSGVAAATMQKVAVVYPAKIMQESPQRAQIIKKLESEFKGRYEELQTLEKKIKKGESKLKRDGELMSKDDVIKLQRDLQTKVATYKLKRKAFEEDNRRRQGEEQQKALKLVSEVINAVAKKGDYDIILNGEQIVFAKPAFDISDEVIKEISKK
ncbi:MAG TPA: OmpH family outer membrane protein [Psychromonas hadalis]|nr:OmpH family outer membrane protein [Psychromonas hadalis]